MSLQLPHLQLRCFGPPTALLEGRPAPREVLWQKHLGLLIYLALSPHHRRTRSHLVGVFWPELPDRRARKALNEAVLRLRKRLGTARLRTDGEDLLLVDDGLEVDAVRFAATATHEPDEAVLLLRGDFLEGFSVDQSTAFEEWARTEGERYRALGTAMLLGIGDRLLANSRFTDAAEAARHALTFSPYSEPAVRLVMRAYALGGDPGSALALFKDFTKRLENELGEHPSAGLVAQAERIRRQHEQPETAPAEPDPPLVGRHSLYRDAFNVIARGLSSGPQMLFVTGLPGMGRSRLISEALKRGTLDGALGVLARPLATDHDAPWSALRLLLRGGLTDSPGLPGARPDALGALAGVLPELRDRFTPRPVADVGDMAAALASVLGAIAEERPIVVALDDAQWADGSSLAALASAVRQLRKARLAVVVTAAQGAGDLPRDLLQLQGDVGRGLPGMSVRLDALGAEDVRALVQALASWCGDQIDADRLTRRLAFETAGNPFFAVTLLNALRRATTLRAELVAWPPRHAPYDASLPFSIPSLVRVAIAVRVGELTRQEQAILGAASVAGEVFDLDIVSFVAERTHTEVERALPAFERRALVSFDGHRYVFGAPLVVEVVRAECLPRGERRRLERRTVEALASRTDLDSRVLRAELRARTQPGTEAVDVALATARDALDAGATRLAQRAFAAAERASRGASLERRDLEELRARL